MPNIEDEELYIEAKEALKQVQNFEPSTLPRIEDLGKSINFSEAVKPAEELILLYKRLSIAALDDFPSNFLTTIKTEANSVLAIFDSVKEFKLDQSNPGSVRDNIIRKIINSYTTSFQQLHPMISYSLHRSADFQRLDTDARAAFKQIKTQSKKLTDELTQHKLSAEEVLKSIREIAAEQGVTQQAQYFKDESEAHDKKAESWRKRINLFAIAVGTYAIASIYLGYLPGLDLTSWPNQIQLTVSKVLIFFILAYMLTLSSKNYLNHRHNAIVNKHRQNALLTYKALVDASDDASVRDAVVVQAASCIFSPQTTGYTASRKDEDTARAKSVVELMSRPTISAATRGSQQSG